MAIWVDNDTRLVVQGITGKEGTFHALACRDYGTKVVAGVNCVNSRLLSMLRRSPGHL